MPIYEATIFMTMHGQAMNNVFHFERGAAYAGQNMTDLANQIINTWIQQIRIEHTNDVTYNGVKVRELASNVAPITVACNISGAQGGHPNNQTEMAYVIRKRSLTIGRTGRGRIYVPGAQAGAADNGFLQQVRINNITNQLALANNNWCSRGTGQQSFKMVLHHSAGGTTDVYELVVAPQYSMLHSRRVGVGM